MRIELIIIDCDFQITGKNDRQTSEPDEYMGSYN